MTQAKKPSERVGQKISDNFGNQGKMLGESFAEISIILDELHERLEKAENIKIAICSCICVGASGWVRPDLKCKKCNGSGLLLTE